MEGNGYAPWRCLRVGRLDGASRRVGYKRYLFGMEVEVYCGLIAVGFGAY